MVEMRLYVEGGGDSKQLRTACRQGFSEFLAKAGLKGCMPRIVACGGRKQTYDDFCTSLALGHAAMLLVDSEDPVKPQQPLDKPELWKPWLHLAQRQADQWPQPSPARDMDCHLMVQCMENWFLADRESLASFFGQGYSATALPAIENPIESVSKITTYQSLAKATKNCKTKRTYEKGEHSFLLLSRIDPAKVIAASIWASRFVTALKNAMAA